MWNTGSHYCRGSFNPQPPSVLHTLLKEKIKETLKIYFSKERFPTADEIEQSLMSHKVLTVNSRIPGALLGLGSSIRSGYCQTGDGMRKYDDSKLSWPPDMCPELKRCWCRVKTWRHLALFLLLEDLWRLIQGGKETESRAEVKWFLDSTSRTSVRFDWWGVPDDLSAVCKFMFPQVPSSISCCSEAGPRLPAPTVVSYSETRRGRDRPLPSPLRGGLTSILRGSQRLNGAKKSTSKEV